MSAVKFRFNPLTVRPRLGASSGSDLFDTQFNVYVMLGLREYVKPKAEIKMNIAHGKLGLEMKGLFRLCLSFSLRTEKQMKV